MLYIINITYIKYHDHYLKYIISFLQFKYNAIIPYLNSMFYNNPYIKYYTGCIIFLPNPKCLIIKTFKIN